MKAGLIVDRLSLTQGAPFWTVSALEYLSRRGLIEISRDRPMCDHPLFGPMLALFGGTRPDPRALPAHIADVCGAKRYLRDHLARAGTGSSGAGCF